MNDIVKKFKKGNRIQQNRSSGIRKMQTAAGGPIGFIKKLAHKINEYGNTEYYTPKVPSVTFSYLINDEMKAHPELTYLLAYENISKKIGSKKTTPSKASAGVAVLGGTFSPWFAAPDIVFDIASAIDEPSNSNTIHTIADFPEYVAKFTPNKIDNYVAKGIQIIGNADDYLSSKGKNLFKILDKSHGQVNNTTDKTSVRESTNVNYRKLGGMLEFLKKGSGIHIKKKNRGKFTEYCGGKVTDECILKGKNSSNPAIRKRATFADNARHFKHHLGGNINKYTTGGSFDIIEYIKLLENPNKVGWDGKVWNAPLGKGYDKNQRGYGIDVYTNKEANALTNGRPGRYLTDDEADTLMRSHLDYVRKAAEKHIVGFNSLSPERQGALLGMLYRGDSVNKSGIDIHLPNDLAFFDSISNYYRSKGLKERANSSDKFFRKTALPETKKFVPYKYTLFVPKFNFKDGGQILKKYLDGGNVITKGLSVLSNWQQLDALNKMTEALNKLNWTKTLEELWKQAQEQSQKDYEDWVRNYRQSSGSEVINQSDIALNHNTWNRYSELLKKSKQELENKNALTKIHQLPNNFLSFLSNSFLS